MEHLEFSDAFKEDRGAMNPGRLKMTNQGIIFKNGKTGKVDHLQGSEIDTVHWQKLATGYGLRIMTKTGQLFRFGGFQDPDHDRLERFFTSTVQTELKNKDMCLKGWNWGTAKFHGSVLSFDVDKTSAFEIPLGHVSHCNAAKNEVTLEFHQNDDAAVSLTELRFHIPTDSNSDVDPVQAFLDNVLAKASIIQATGDAIVTFKELQCLTPRGRYDIKVFPSFIQLHGKTFDYKIPLSTVLRLFLLPHKDGRQTFFVLSLDPPIKQGQTRYHFLILLFSKEDEMSVELALSEDEIKEKYQDKLQKEMSGPTFEVITSIMKVLVQRKITVPGSFKGHSKTNCITCSYRAGNGLLYPLERGFIYIHKPPVHIRFDEVLCVNFARSGGSTRSFDFEIETKNSVIHTFSSIEKEEYGKLFDFVTTKGLRIKNRGGSDVEKKKPIYNEDELVDSDLEDEPDAYLQRVKAEGREREEAAGSSEDESDESFNPEGSGSEVAEEFDSNASSSSDSEDGSEEDGSEKEKKPKEIHKEKTTKSAKTVKEPGMRKRRKKKPRDANRPKRPASAYFLWLNETREKIKQENPKISVTEIIKKAAEIWRTIDDKTKWEKRAQEAKKEYEKAMEIYKASGGGQEIEKIENTDKKSKYKEKKSSVKSPQKSSVKSPQKSPVKSNAQYKSKEYVSTSEESEDDDDDDRPLKPKKEKKSDKEIASSASSSEEEMSVSGSD